MVTDERSTGTVVALRYDHGVLLAAGGQLGGSCRLDPLYERFALGACGSPPQVARLYRAGGRMADIRARHRTQLDLSSRTLTFAYASVLRLMTAEADVLPDVRLLVAGPSDLHEVASDGQVIEIDRCAAIGRDAGSILEEMSQVMRGNLDLDAACFTAVDALGHRHADLDLAGVDDRRVRQPFFRVPSGLVERARRSRSAARDARS